MRYKKCSLALIALALVGFSLPTSADVCLYSPLSCKAIEQQILQSMGQTAADIRESQCQTLTPINGFGNGRYDYAGPGISNGACIKLKGDVALTCEAANFERVRGAACPGGPGTVASNLDRWDFASNCPSAIEIHRISLGECAIEKAACTADGIHIANCCPSDPAHNHAPCF